jgi:hypothetical protein
VKEATGQACNASSEYLRSETRKRDGLHGKQPFFTSDALKSARDYKPEESGILIVA